MPRKKPAVKPSGLPPSVTGEMTGETKDAIIDLVNCARELEPVERKGLIECLLDHLCAGCGSELNKWGPWLVDALITEKNKRITELETKVALLEATR